MRFSVLIPTGGRPEVLRETLQSLLACEPPPAEVVVVDSDADRSAQPVMAGFSDRHPELSVRYVPSPRGASIQRQACLEAATGEVVVFIDDDATADPRLLAVLEDAYRDPGVVGATGRILQPSYRSFGNQQSWIRRLLLGRAQGRMTGFGYPRHLQDPDTPRDVEFMQGCLMSARRLQALAVAFDMELGGPRGIALLEDEDFSYRLSRLGRVRHLPDAIVHHKALGFRAREPREYSRLIVRDRAYLVSKNFRPTVWTLVQFGCLTLLLVAHRLVNREWAGVAGIGEGLIQARREGFLRPGAPAEEARPLSPSPELR